MTKTIQISDESYGFLKDLINEIDNQDNRMTASPYYYVIQEKVTRPTAEGCGQYIVYFDSDDLVDYTREELIESKEIDTDIDYTFDDYLDEHPEIREIEVKTEWAEPELSNVFFTEKAIEKHIAANKYHWIEPRSYVKHAWRNPEIESLFKAIREIAESETKSTNTRWCKNCESIRSPNEKYCLDCDRKTDEII